METASLNYPVYQNALHATQPLEFVELAMKVF